MGAGHFSQFEFISAAAGKPYNRAYARWKCTPFGACGTTFPPEGELFPLLQNEQLKLAQGEAPLELPPSGEVPPQAGIGVHFHRAAGPVGLFSSPGRAAPWFYYKSRPI